MIFANEMLLRALLEMLLASLPRAWNSAQYCHRTFHEAGISKRLPVEAAFAERNMDSAILHVEHSSVAIAGLYKVVYLQIAHANINPPANRPEAPTDSDWQNAQVIFLGVQIAPRRGRLRMCQSNAESFRHHRP